MSEAQTHESRDVNGRLTLAAGIGILIVLALLVAGLRAILLSSGYQDARMVEAPPPERDARNPQPSLQAYPRYDGRQFRVQQAEAMQGYRWVDRDAGVAEIPVARAIEILAAQQPLLE